MILMMMRTRAGVALTVVAGLALAACGSIADSTGSATPSGAVLTVVASFYPLQYATERVLGARGRVTNLTPPGAEPHDLELTPKDVAALADAPLVVYLSGFQPAVDAAIDAEAKDAALDVATPARLTLKGADEGGTVGRDPHFWLDPTRLADVADAIAGRLGTAEPAGAATFTANAAALRTELTALDGELKTGLATCASTDVVTSHEAFGYLAERYRLTQLGIAGLSPETEPDAGTLAKVTDFVRANEVTTIYYETLVSPDVATTVARSTGATTAVLDPLEGISDSSAARDYFGVMRANLATLRAGQRCG